MNPATYPWVYCEQALLPDGWARNVRLRIADGAFAEIVRSQAAQPTDVRVALGLPGLANLHSHAFQRAMAGLTEYRGQDADSFWSWREWMYRFLAHMTPDDVQAISAQAYVEMLEAGFTRVGEFHYLHRDPAGNTYADPAELSARIVAAAAESGMSLSLLPVFYAHGGFAAAQPTAGQRRFLSDLDGYARLLEACRKLLAQLPQARLGIAPHSLRAVTPDELARLVPLAPAGPIHMHASEQLREVEECVAWSGRRPIEWLLDHVGLDARWCLVHATHMTEQETRRLAQSGAIAGLCPTTEANLGDGCFPGLPYATHGGVFGIGSDSNVQIGPAAELRQLEYSQRVQLRARNVLSVTHEHTGRALFEGALRGGSRALDVPCGIQLGAPADLVALDVRAVAFAGREGDRVLDSWIFTAPERCIDAVWSAGVQVVQDGRHRARDAIEARFRRVLDALLHA